MGYDYMRALDKACYLGRQEERTASTNSFLFFPIFLIPEARTINVSRTPPGVHSIGRWSRGVQTARQTDRQVTRAGWTG